MDAEAGWFRVLLAEDDPVSREFLCAAIATCGAAPAACADGPAAFALARNGTWNLLILDHHLPGCDGDAVLSALRADPGCLRADVPAIATTAEPEGVRAALLQAGFAEVLPKPVTLQALRAALGRYGCRLVTLDDQRAIDACGSAEAVVHLRRLFAEQELPQAQAEIDCYPDDHHNLSPLLHRLRASCGFCGATALARASDALHHALATGQDTAAVQVALRDFSKALQETRAALHARLGRED